MGHEVVVVGGGPAGASTARFLAKNGVKVLLIEGKRLPRFKLCGGCLSGRAVSLLPEGWESEVLNTVRGGFLGLRGERFHHGTSPLPVAYIVDRASFDYFLVERAVREGAELWEGVKFLGFEVDGKLRVITDRGVVETDFLVGADGFYTRVGRQLGYVKRRFFRSVEFWTEGDLVDKVVIDLGLVSRGYGWLFPAGGKMSVGLATAGRENLLEVLRDYVKEHRFLKRKEVRGVKGWMIPFTVGKEDLHLGKGRVLLVGDAANMVDPLLGEGIYYGMLGGKLLAEALLRDPGRAQESYREAVEGKLLPEFLYAGRIARLAYTFQRSAFRMGRRLERFFPLLTGERSYRELYRVGLVEFVTYLLTFENLLHIIISKILRRR